MKAHGEDADTDEIVRHMTDLETNLALVLKGTQQMIVDLKRDLVQRTQKVVCRHHELLRNLRFHVTNPDLRATVPDFFYDDFLQLNGNSSKDALKVIEMLNTAPQQAQPDQL